MTKRILSFTLALMIMLSLVPAVAFAATPAKDAADKLYTLGLFKGVGVYSDGTPNFDLNRAPTRSEAITILVRLLGKETEAQSGAWSMPFTDVAEWAKPYVGYAYANKLTAGISATTFGGEDAVTASQYITFILRALGYESGSDFQWDAAWELSDRLGFTAGEYSAATAAFTRGHATSVSFDALSATQKGSGDALYKSLISKGAITQANAEKVGLLSTTGGIVASPDGSSYTYMVPMEAPKYDYYEVAFSSSHEFRDIYMQQFGTDKAIVYDMMASICIQIVYDDTIDFDKEIKILGFDRIATFEEFRSALLAVQMDMPFITYFLLYQYSFGPGAEYGFRLSRSFVNYSSDGAPIDKKSSIATREKIIAVLNEYRSAVAGITDDIEKVEIAGKLFDSGGVYDTNAPYGAVSALLDKRGVCGNTNVAFTLICNAIGVPSYEIVLTNVSPAAHAAVLVKPNGGKLQVIDVTFGNYNPKVVNISTGRGNFVGSNNRTYLELANWNNDVLNFSNFYYFPDVDIIAQLGGLS